MPGRTRRWSASQASRQGALAREAGEREAVEDRNERVRGPGPRRHDGNARGARSDGRDPGQEGIDFRPRNQEGDRPGDVAAAGRRPVAPPLHSCLRHEQFGQLSELDDPGAPVGALAASPLSRVPAVQAQELDAHLDTAAYLAERRANQRRVGVDPGVEVRRGHDSTEPERQRGRSLQRRGDDVVVDGEAPGGGPRRERDGAGAPAQFAKAAEHDGPPDACLGRTPRCWEPVGDRVEVLVHTAFCTPRGGAVRSGRIVPLCREGILGWTCCPGTAPRWLGFLPAPRRCFSRRPRAERRRPEPFPRRPRRPRAPGFRSWPRPPRGAPRRRPSRSWRATTSPGSCWITRGARGAGCRAVPAPAWVGAWASAEPFLARHDVLEFLLDHPEFATHLTRTLRLGRYRVWRAPDGGLWFDDGWGVVGQLTIVYAAPGTRVIYGRGQYTAGFLPSIQGQAVVV